MGPLICGVYLPEGRGFWTTGRSSKKSPVLGFDERLGGLEVGWPGNPPEGVFGD